MEQLGATERFKFGLSLGQAVHLSVVVVVRVRPRGALGYETSGRLERPAALGYETFGRPGPVSALGYETFGPQAAAPDH